VVRGMLKVEEPQLLAVASVEEPQLLAVASVEVLLFNELSQ
jgi:hypothetical protein